jgi:hypothetical protein
VHNADEPLDRDLGIALDALDAPVRNVSVDAIIREARSRTRQRQLRLAAAAVVMLTAVAVAALPGSPVRRWLTAAARSITSQEHEQLVAPRDSVPKRAQGEMRGVSTEIGTSTQISFSDLQQSGDIVVRLIPESQLRIRSPEFPSSYSLRAGNITVRNPGSRASYDIEVSERSEIRVVVAGRVVFRRLNGAVLVGPQARADGAYVLSFQEREIR